MFASTTAQRSMPVSGSQIRPMSTTTADGSRASASCATRAPNAEAASAFGARVAHEAEALLPSAVVVDIGLICDPDTGIERWAVVEANMAWFAHCYAA